MIVYDASAGCPLPGDIGLACDDDSCGPIGFNSEVQVPVAIGDELLVQVGGWNGSDGDGTLTIAMVEDCLDGLDNDGDGDIDCGDSDCDLHPTCNFAGAAFQGLGLSPGLSGASIVGRGVGRVGSHERGSPSPPSPYPGCGNDPTGDPNNCDAFNGSGC